MSSDKSFKRFPKKIVVKGVEYKISLDNYLRDDDGKLCSGLHDHERKVIHIDKNMGIEEKRQTFIHELFHAYLHECHVNEGIDSQLEEAIVESLSQSITKSFVLNWKNSDD